MFCMQRNSNRNWLIVVAGEGGNTWRIRSGWCHVGWPVRVVASGRGAESDKVKMPTPKLS